MYYTLYAGIENYLLFVAESQLHLIHLDTVRASGCLKVSSMSVDILLDMIYWIDPVEVKIFVAPLFSFFMAVEVGASSMGGVQAVVFDDLISPEAVVVDWIGRTLYWADSGRGHIEVLDLEGGSRRVLVDGLSQATSLTLDLVSLYAL